MYVCIYIYIYIYEVRDRGRDALEPGRSPRPQPQTFSR